MSTTESRIVEVHRRPRQSRTRQGRRSQAERSQTTIGELVAAARALFAENGFVETSIEDIVTAADVTRGALYHHFASKTEIFAAVFETEQQRIAQAVNEAAGRKEGDAWERLEAGCLAFLGECLDPGVQQIVLIDGFVALGWDGMHEIEYRYTLDGLERGIERAMREGAIPRRSVAPLAHMLFGGLCQSAINIARSDNQRKLSREVKREVHQIFVALRMHA